MKFPQKLWKIVEECTSGAIGWGMDGDRIFVDYDKFELEFLCNDAGGFKAKNIDSFVRQLNLYGFRKCSRYSDVHEFKNRYFIRGRKDLLKLMSRRMKYTKISIAPDNIEDKDALENQRENNNETHNLKNDFRAILEAQSSNYNILMNQYQHYYGLYYDWLKRNAIFPMTNEKTSLNDPEAISKDGKSEDSLQSKESNLDVANLGMHGNVMFVPIPVHCGWHPVLSNANFASPMNMSFQSEDGMSNTTPE